MAQQAYAALGDRENVRAAARRTQAQCERLLETEPDHPRALSFLVIALADLGETERAHEWAKRAVLFDPDNTRLQYNLACGMVILGDLEFACELLEGIIDKISAGYVRWMQTDNSLDPLRAHPRFIAALARGAARFPQEQPEAAQPASA
jgi:adenylate cyclase